MKSHLLTIIKKELFRFFGDKRMLLTALLPGLMIYAMYSFMGEGFSGLTSVDEEYTYQIHVVGESQFLAGLEALENVKLISAKAEEVPALQDAIKNAECDLLVIFPENFDAAVGSYDVTSGMPAPNVEIYYNSAETPSSNARGMVTGLLNQVEQMMTNKFDICAGEKKYDMATEEDIAMMMFSMLLPMLVMTFIYTGCLSVSSESIAGEKERGTIATLLVTPMRRRDLALGKMVSLSFIGLVSGISSFVGTMLSLPKLMGGSGLEEVSLGYSTQDYVLLLLVILSTTLMIVGIISIISAFAKSVKEAGTMCMPLMLTNMMLSFSNMMGFEAASKWYLYLIPLYNTVQCMSGIFAMEYELSTIFITVGANLVYSGVLVVLLTKMFNSERIMYT